ncbi:hypothetical protein [Enterobacter cloacae]
MTTNTGELTANINTAEAGATSSSSEITQNQIELQRESFRHGCAALLNDINHAARADDLLHRTRRAEVELKMLASYLEGQVNGSNISELLAMTAGDKKFFLVRAELCPDCPARCRPAFCGSPAIAFRELAQNAAGIHGNGV